MSIAAERTLGRLPSVALLCGLWTASVGTALYLRHTSAGPFWGLMGGAALASFLIAILEYVVPYENWRPSWREILQDVLHMGFLTAIVRPLARGIFVATVIAGIENLNTRGFLPNRPDISSAPLLVQILVEMLLVDLCFYLAHRTLHAIGPLWRCHAIHHASKSFYWLRSMRIHCLEASFTTIMNLIGVSVLRVSPVAMTVAFVIINTLITLQHSNVSTRLGWLSYVIVTPELHRVHHSVDITEERSNYAGMFSLWDHLFGTFHVVTLNRIGLASDEESPVTFVQDFLFPFRRHLPGTSASTDASASPSASASLE